MGCVVAAYPEKIDMKNSEDVSRMKHTLNFFKEFPYILPCKYCRESFIKFSKEIPITKYLKTRKELCYWLYTIHNKVNKKLNIPKSQIPTFNEVCQKFEQYRAQCNIDKTGCVHGKNGYTSKKCELNIVPIKSTNLYKDTKKIDKILSMTDVELKDIRYKLFDISLINGIEITNTVKSNINKIMKRMLKIYGYNFLNGEITLSSNRKKIYDKKFFKHIINFLTELNNQNKHTKWLIIGKESCPYCINAKNLAIRNKLDFRFIEISDLSSKELKALKNVSNTIPIILKKTNGNFKNIGGFNELKEIMSFKKNIFI